MPLLALMSVPILFMVGGFVAMYVFKIDLVERVLGDLESFWAQRAVWSWTPRRVRLPPNPRRKRKRMSPAKRARREARRARKAAERAARWPYE